MTSTLPTRARVLVAYSQNGPEAPETFRRGLIEAGDRVRGLLEARGADVIVANAADPDDEPESLVASVDAVVVLGGADISPECYAQPQEADNLYYVDVSADRFEVALVRSATTESKPILGVCRGSQIINVAMGGTLVQDLGSGLHNFEVVGSPWTDHEVQLAEGSTLRDVLRDETIVVRTGHHQAVDDLGEGLRVSARAEDGVIEAIEGIDGWVMGVQWHPEEAKGDPEALDRLLDAFVTATEAAAAIQPGN